MNAVVKPQVVVAELSKNHTLNFFANLEDG
jgi:hypothetical protein